MGKSVGFGLGILVRVVSCSGFLISLAGLGVGRAGLLGIFVGVNDGMRDDSGYGTGEVGGLVGSWVGIDDSIELANEDDIDDGLAFGPAIFVCVGLGVVMVFGSGMAVVLMKASVSSGLATTSKMV